MPHDGYSPPQQTGRLFESLQIGPKRARNRFYLAPHGIGLGALNPEKSTRIRSTAAQGGWAVVSTEQTEIGPATDMSPAREFQLYTSEHVAVAERICRGIQDGGALAAIELSFSGCNVSNWSTWEPSIAATAGLVDDGMGIASPVSAVFADKAALKLVRDQQFAATRRAADIGFDIVYVYASAVLSLPGQFLSPRYNKRTDDYGGSIRNRVRLIRELIDVTLEAAQGRMAVAVRMTLDDLLDPKDNYSDLAEAFDEIGDLPDLWDLTIGGMGEDAGSARFNKSEQQTETLKRVKMLTKKPVAAVGLISSTEAMARYIEEGVVDLIAAARASIADPEFPNKIQSGREDEIVHCIKCNVCVACDLIGVPVRCTQNASFGQMATALAAPPHQPAKDTKTIAVVGAGPAGLEAARLLVADGFNVDLFERRSDLGGRVTDEATLPGLGLWRHVVDDRVRAIDKSRRARVHLETAVTAKDLRSAQFAAVIVATGSEWDADTFGRCGDDPISVAGGVQVVTPKDIYQKAKIGHRTVIYDAEGFYLGGVLAEHLVSLGRQVTLVTPFAEVSPFTKMTMEQFFVHRRLLNLGVDLKLSRRLSGVENDQILHDCVYAGRSEAVTADTLLLVGSRRPNRSLLENPPDDTTAIPFECAGDVAGPGMIAHAIASANRVTRRVMDRIA